MRITKLPILVAFGVATTATAVAQPKKPAPAKPPAPRPTGSVPTKAVPCAKDMLTLSVVDASPVVCWETGCMKLDVLHEEATAVPKPPAPKRWLFPTPEVKADSVCLGTTCKPLGKRLSAAVAAFRKDSEDNAAPDNPTVSATTDLKAVGIPNGSNPAQVWSVAQDKPLKLKAPPSKGDVYDVTAVGNLFAVDWRACAGPCAEMELVDSSGRNKGPGGTGGGPVFQLDAKRFVAVSENTRVQVYDLATGKLLGKLELEGQDGGPLDAVRIDDETIAVMYGKSDNATDIVIVSVFPKGKPEVTSAMRLPNCD
ncbi:MAG: hypothetical protein SFX73_38300 [Kofleriaceae bacterium]|nr:hypothetical protein [Kofleriaceae bacterium]